MSAGPFIGTTPPFPIPRPMGWEETIPHATPSNPSGIHPSGFKVLIEPKAAAEKIGSILIPDATADKQKYATTEGKIIEVGPAAFTHVTSDEWGGKTPKAGDRVIYTKYGGFRIDKADTRDGKEYLLVKGEDIHAVLE